MKCSFLRGVNFFPGIRKDHFDIARRPAPINRLHSPLPRGRENPETAVFVYIIAYFVNSGKWRVFYSVMAENVATLINYLYRLLNNWYFFRRQGL